MVTLISDLIYETIKLLNKFNSLRYPTLFCFALTFYSTVIWKVSNELMYSINKLQMNAHSDLGNHYMFKVYTPFVFLISFIVI